MQNLQNVALQIKVSGLSCMNRIRLIASIHTDTGLEVIFGNVKP